MVHFTENIAGNDYSNKTLRLTVKWLNVLTIPCPHMIIRGIIRSLTKKIMNSRDLKRYMD